jgi:NADH-quinone oxidoreductase subunit L
MLTEIEQGTWLRWIPLLPLLAAIVMGVSVGVVRRALSDRVVVGLSLAAVGGSLLATVLSFIELISQEKAAPIRDRVATWIGSGVGSRSFNVDFVLRFDALSAVMCLVVTGVGILILVYSFSYMEEDDRDDRGFERFFCYMNLFFSAMLVLVLADNLVLMFMGWEGVALCSYLLIGFWYASNENAAAGAKAFVVGRIGDAGLLIGILLLFWGLAGAGTPSLSFQGIQAGMPALSKQVLTLPALLGGGEIRLVSVIAIALFVGAIGKSAQGPLFVWLPDAMAGPTPVSALIHAATMVTAGVYMVTRLSFLYAAAPEAAALIAWTGALTAVLAALAACVQTDLKKVLAYSTISQLGFMFLAAGVGANTAAIFHLVSHAFFKALLFMTVGVIILAMRHEQDMRNMGNIGSRIRFTRTCMWIGVLSMAGAPPSAGFFSKEQILSATHSAAHVPGHAGLYWIGLVAVGLTAFYGIRLIYGSIYGETRLPAGVRREEIEDPDSRMLWPMGILAALSVAGFLVGLPQFWGDQFGVPESNSIHHFLIAAVTDASVAEGAELDPDAEWVLVVRALGMSLAGGLFAVLLYLVRPSWPEKIARRLAAFHRLALNAGYVDTLYRALVVRPLLALSDRVLFRWLDVRLIDGVLVMGSARALRGLASDFLRYAQSGYAQLYLALMVAGSLAMMLYFLSVSG